jgi:nuclear GTP-binding protein
VDQIVARTDPSRLQHIYNIQPFSSTLEFLTMLALTSGRLHKGGTPDIIAAARQIIQDWNSQKIPYFTIPPEVHPSNIPSAVSAAAAAKYGLGEAAGESMIAPGAEDVGSVSIVKEMAPAFDLGGLFSQADAGAFGGLDCEMQDREQTAVDDV